MSGRSSWPLWRRTFVVLREEGFSGVCQRIGRWVEFLKHRWRPASPDAVYRQEFFAATQAANRHTGAFADYLISEYHPKTVFDVGCGDCLLLAALSARGVQGFGVDGSTAAIGFAPDNLFVFKANLGQALVVNRRFDLVLCVEVAEHLAPRFADTLVSSLVAAAKERIIFSAAHPGQGGEDHLNEQPMDYWLKKFSVHGLEPHEGETARIKQALQSADAPDHLRENMILLRRIGPGH